MKFAAFIMTYERPTILHETIGRLLEQTLRPEKILVVDNSISYETEGLIKDLNDPAIEYFRVGYNSGPAGAAKRGLQRLVEEGYDWIHWADDDDPARFNDAFEILLKQTTPDIGVIGAVGSLFDWRTGLKKRYRDDQLNGLLEADSIGGGYCMIVNARAINAVTLPDEDLFFGMEEFDFCQRVKRAGFRVCVSGELMFRYRQLNNKLGVDKKPSLIPRRDLKHLHREYYSYRNAIYLMSHTYKKRALVLKYLMRIAGKLPLGFVKGPRYGWRNATLLLKAVYHGLSKKMGKRV
jgi:glycosyltransferase involved in cell wall biosynthesis